jgi:hypothetical protein
MFDKEKERLLEENAYLKKLVDRLMMKIGIPPVDKPEFNIKTEVRAIQEETAGTGSTVEQYGGGD